MTSASQAPPSDGVEALIPDDLPEELLSQLFAAMQVQEDQKEASAQSLAVLLTLLRKHHAFDEAEPEREKAIKQHADLAKKAAAFQSALRKLSPTSRMFLGAKDYRREMYGDAGDGARRDQLNHLMITDGSKVGCMRYDAFCMVIERIRAAAAEEYWPRKGKVGRRSKSLDGQRSRALDHFIRHLHWHEHKHGWHLEVTPDDGTGSLVQVLKLVAPHLPDGLICPELWTPNDDGVYEGLKRIQRLATVARKEFGGARSERGKAVRAAPARRSGQKLKAK